MEALLLLLAALSRVVVSNSVIGGIYREEIVCWTCPPHATNPECNRWAPNIGCPLGQTVCMTRHAVNQSTGHSVSVEKMCVRPTECSTDHIGCMNTHPNVKTCVSCCTSTLCNEDLPFDESSAINLSSVTSSASQILSSTVPSISAVILTCFSRHS